MSIVQHPTQFQTNVIPLHPMDQAQMDLWLRLGLSAFLPPQPNAWRGTTPADCRIAKERIALVLGAAADFVKQALGSLGENMPLDLKVELADTVDSLEHAEKDAVAYCEITADRVRGA